MALLKCAFQAMTCTSLLQIFGVDAFLGSGSSMTCMEIANSPMPTWGVGCPARRCTTSGIQVYCKSTHHNCPAGSLPCYEKSSSRRRRRPSAPPLDCANSGSNMLDEAAVVGNTWGHHGPFVGMGISGWNDLTMHRLSNPGECAKKCRDHSECQSFDWGARSYVNGECWLSTANRTSAGDSYTSWTLYDYYERAEKTIVETAVASADFSTLVAALGKAELVSALDGGPFTVFAPTNAAFAAYLQETGLTAEELLDSDLLKDILLYHVVGGNYPAAQIGAELGTLQGGNLVFSFDGDSPTVNGAAVVSSDIVCRNGVIHAIDTVLIPSGEVAQTIVETASASDNFSLLVAALGEADLVSALNGGPFTVFAPTDAAFNKYLQERPQEKTVIAEDSLGSERLKDILLYHVVSGEYLAAQLGEELETLQGGTLRFSSDGGSPTVNGAAVVVSDIVCRNGVIHAIDTVLFPSAEVKTDRDSTWGHYGPFVAMGISGWNDLGYYKLDSPEECAKRCRDHSECQSFDWGARSSARGECWLSTANRASAGGSYTSWSLYDYYERAEKTIVETAVASNEFSTLVAALGKAKLVDTLEGGPFTVFAPTNDAFEAYLQETGVTAGELLESDMLRDILLYHVVRGEYLAAQLGGELDTLQGGKLLLSMDGDSPNVNGGTVVTSDAVCRNGVIHAIDTVLLPSKSMEMQPLGVQSVRCADKSKEKTCKKIRSGKGKKNCDSRKAKTDCRKTCGHCSVDAGSVCEDRLPKKWKKSKDKSCEWMKANDLCCKSSYIKNGYCAKTCGRCDGQLSTCSRVNGGRRLRLIV